MAVAPDPDTHEEARLFEAMVLLASLSAAGSAWHRIAERRAGRDPSAQEADTVTRPYLHKATRDLSALLMRVQQNLALQARQTGLAALVRRFENLMTVHRLVQRLQVVHQRLLSLYPAVSEGLIEQARTLVADGQGLHDLPAEALPDHLTTFVARGLDFTAWLQREVG